MGVAVGSFVQDSTQLDTDERSFSGTTGTVPNATLVLDIDQVTTRALLFDVVEGVARFIAVGERPSTGRSPLGDVVIGVTQAIHDLELQTGRSLIAGDQLILPQRETGDGVDACLVTGMPVPPLQAALLAVDQTPLSRMLVAAARRTITTLADSAEDLPRSETGGLPSPVIVRDWLRTAQPEIIVLVLDTGEGSADDTALLLDAVAEVARENGPRQGIVVGDTARQEQAAVTLGNLMQLSGIHPGEFAPEEIAAALETELRETYLQRVQEQSDLRLLANATFVDRLQGMEAVTAFLNRRMGRNVLSVAASEGMVLQAATQERTVSILRADRDLSLQARSLLRIATDRVTRWLPYRATPEEITHWALNRALRPDAVIHAKTDTVIAAALGRELIADLVEEPGLAAQPAVDLIAAGPAVLSDDPVLAAVTLLDGVMPVPTDGLVSMALDAEGMAAAVGALATLDATYAREILENDFLTPLGTCIVVTGQASEGALALRGELRTEQGESTRFSVPFGNLHRLPIPEGATGTLVLELEPGFSLGQRGTGQTVELELGQELVGGDVGVIIDARGRPLALPDDPDARVARLAGWFSDLGIAAE